VPDQRTFVTFEATFPDDARFLSSGDLVVPGGRSVCLAIAGLLVAQGFRVSGPKQHSYYGWEFTAKNHGRKVWFLIQFPDPWLLIAKDSPGVRAIFNDSAFHFHETLDTLANAMIEDARFRRLSWFKQAEYESGQRLGCPSP
jgi:hypothetical protein